MKNIEIKPGSVFLGVIFISLLVVVLTGKADDLYGVAYGTYIATKEGHRGVTDPTVAYYRVSTVDDFKSAFGAPLLLISGSMCLYLLYNFYKKKEFPTLFLIIWFVLGLIAMRTMIRLSFYLALIIPVLVLLLAGIGFQHNKDKENEAEEMLKSTKKTIKEKAQSAKGSARFANFIIVAIIIFLMVPGLNASISNTRGAKGADGSVTPWRDVGTWLKNNAPEDSLLLSWWDYGYYLQTFADMRTIVDGGNAGPQVTGGSNVRNIDVAKMFTTPEDEALEVIKTYNIENRPVYVLVCVEEFGKSGAINHHVTDQLYLTNFRVPKSGSMDQDNKNLEEIFSRNMIKTYFVSDARTDYLVWAQIQMDEVGEYHPEWSDKLLVKLLPFNTGYGQGLKHFTLVYSNGYVLVYKLEL